MTIYELTLFQKMVRVKTGSLLFCLRYDPLIVFRKQNHNFQFHKTMSHDLELQKKVTYGCGLDPNRIQWGVNVRVMCWVGVDVEWWRGGFDRWRRKWGAFLVGYIQCSFIHEQLFLCELKCKIPATFFISSQKRVNSFLLICFRVPSCRTLKNERSSFRKLIPGMWLSHLFGNKYF